MILLSNIFRWSTIYTSIRPTSCVSYTFLKRRQTRLNTDKDIQYKISRSGEGERKEKRGSKAYAGCARSEQKGMEICILLRG